MSLSKSPISFLTLDSIIDPYPIAVTPDTSVMAVMDLMHKQRAEAGEAFESTGVLEARASCILVQAENKPIGILTEQDLVRLIARGMNFEPIAIDLVMTRQLITLNKSAYRDVFTVIRLFIEHRIRHLPIVNEYGELIGLTTASLICQRLRHFNLLKMLQVQEVMHSKEIQASPTAFLQQIARQMAEHQVSSVVITEALAGSENQNIPVGTISERDIVELQALRVDFANTQAQAVMNSTLQTLNYQANLFEANQALQNKPVRRVLITGDRGELLGIVTHMTILQLLEPIELMRILEVLQEERSGLGLYEKIPLEVKAEGEVETNFPPKKPVLSEKPDLISVLLLEDDRTYKYIVQRNLERSPTFKSDLKTVETLSESLKYLKEKFFDVILLDLNLPDSQGIDTLQAIQESAPNVAIVVLTGTEDEQQALQSIQMGAQDYLIKQEVNPDLLIRSINYAIGRKQIEKDLQVKNVQLAFANQALEKKTAQLKQKNKALNQEIAERKKVQQDWQTLAIELEHRVAERTAKLETSNKILQREIHERKQAESKLQSYAERQRLLNQTALKIRQSLNLDHILNTTVEQVRSLLACDRVLVYQFDRQLNGTIVAESVAPGCLATLGTYIEDTCFRTGGAKHYQQGKKTALNNVELADLSDCHRQLLARFQIKANLVVPILLPNRQTQENLDSRPSTIGTVDDLPSEKPTESEAIQNPLWGLLMAHESSGPRHWQTDELEILDDLAVQLAIAIQQAQLYHQAQTELQQRRKAEAALRQLNQHLEQQVRQRTTELQKSNKNLSQEVVERQQAQAELEQQYMKSSLFGEITLKIRQSLRLEEILQTTVAEIQKILQCDRVLIYRIFDNDNGCVVAETVRPEYPTLMNMEFPEETFPQECQKKYANGNIVAIADIDRAYGESSPCMMEFLQSWQIKAKLVVPIGKSQNIETIWGLIVAHHCQETHLWTEFEKELIGQLSNQVTVAVQQAHLLAKQQNTLQALLNSQEQLQDLFDRTNDLIQSVSFCDNRFIYVNQAWIETLNYTLEEVSQLSYLDTIAPEHHEQCRQMCDAFKTGKLNRFDAVELSFLSKDGRKIILEGDITCRLSDGEPVAFQAIFRDVTDRRKTQAQLQRALQELAYQKQALDQIAVVAISDPEGIITYVNDKFCEISQYQPQELLGQTHRIINSGYHPPSFFQQMWTTITSGEIWRGEIKNKAKDGSFYWVDATIVPFVDDSGKPLQYLAIRIDITDRKVAEVGLRQQLAAVEAAIDGIAIIHNNSYIYVNQAHAQLFGYQSSEELLGKSWDLLYEPEELQRLEREIFPLLSQQKHWRGEATAKRSDGSTFAEEQSFTLTEYGDLICVCRDISDRKQAEQQLRDALANAQELSELKSRFISMTSHEFRTPLTTILGAAEILKYYGHKWDEDKKLKYLDRIYSTVQHMTGMLDDVLLLGRIESGKIELQPRAIEVNEFCQSLVEELKIGIGKEYQIILTCETTKLSSSFQYNLDEKLLRHILGNLLTNAIKYSPKDSQIYFHVFGEQNQVKFHVQDQGIGIPDEDQKHLFESFHRAKNVGNIQGTGLGLSIIKKSIDLHQGKIVYHSVLGQGSKFSVTLPSIYTY